MNLEPLFSAPLPVQLHVATVLPAFVLGTWMIFASNKGSMLHKRVGYAYWGLMIATAAATLWINGLSNGHWTFIHLFIPLTLWGVGSAWWHIRKGNREAHKWAMIGTYSGALIIAGALAFLPGRIMNQVVFGS